MYAFGFVLVAILVGSSCAIPVGFDLYSDDLYDYYNSYYEPSLGSDLSRSPFPFSQFTSIISPNYLSSAVVVGPDLLSTVPADFAYTYPYASSRTVNFGKENYLRDYGYGSTEVGMRDRVLVRSNVPSVIPTNYLSSTAVAGSDLLSTFPADFPKRNPFVSPRIVNVAKENYVRDYGYGSAEAGVGNQISLRADAFAILSPSARAWSFLPVGKCLRGINRFNQRPASPLLPIDYDVAF